MRTFINSCALLITLLSFSCKNGKKNDAHYDRQVMKEIFPVLMDSLYVETMFLLTPPPVEQITDSVTGRTETVPVAAGKRNKDQFRKELAEKYKDSSIITLVVKDEIHAMDKSFILAFEKKYQGSAATIHQGYKLSKDEIFSSQLCKSVLYSAYTSSSKLGSDPYVLKEFSFSTIVFNKELNRGMLQCDYSCGSLCGYGFEIHIRKEIGKWLIERVENIWVS